MTESTPEPDGALAAPARSPRLRVGVGAAVALLVLGVGAAVLAGLLGGGGGVQSVAELSPSAGAVVTPAPTTATASATVIVHVLGQVRRPGVYELPAESRVIDAVAAAGGFSAHADQSALNLARKLVDGEQVLVPQPGQAVPATTSQATAPAAAGETSGAKIDLNTATEEQLETLPRVGPALAQRILDWRQQNGGFASVEDLKNVSGIGDKTFAELEDLVTVG
ncbi:ComEA family DNA-binding protein [Gryllotalpicola ginsengisoli]|uniref:ComEA family DNA-binding protein n=1 Tax=Gryllotalpicola ginsengisoli TaxID=444608 RepID=UPI0003B74AC1|nr:ComEA family DNA-binding protein [Gryllotalpicola ginsengisoli]